jgi:hypothetical protein
MKIELTKDHKLVSRVLPKGTQIRVSNKFGRELIKLKVAKEFNGYTLEEETEEMLLIAFDNEEKPKVKNITKHESEDK